MAISESNREFVKSLIDYYTNEAESYRQIAEQYTPEIESVPDAAFGIIAGCIYTSFLEVCRNQQIELGVDEMTEFNAMLKDKASAIREAIVGDVASAGTGKGMAAPVEKETDDGTGFDPAGDGPGDEMVKDESARQLHPQA